MKRQALIDRMVELQSTADRIANVADTEGRPLNSDERLQLETVLRDFDEAKASVELLGRSAANDRFLSDSPGRQTDPDPIGSARAQAHGADPSSGPVLGQRTLLTQRGLASTNAAFMQAVEMMSRDMGGWRNEADFFRTLAVNPTDPRLRMGEIMNSANENSLADGGGLVPQFIVAAVLGGAYVNSGILRRLRTVMTSTASVHLVGADLLDHSNNAVAGLRAVWTPEGTEISEQTPKIRAISLRLAKLACLVGVTSELMEDAPAAEQMVRSNMMECARVALEHAVLVGSGIPGPKGLVNCDSTVTVDAEAGQPSDTISHANLVSMQSRLHVASVGSAVWICSPSALESLLKLTHNVRDASDSDNVGGSSVAARFNSLSAEYELLGRALVVSEHLPQLGDSGDIILADLNQYALALRNQIRIASDAGPLFAKDMVSLRMTLRANGHSLWSAPVTPASGGATLAPCVKIAAR
ncbi:MAG: phage major capsid protein [Nitrospiraceae bacterium]